MTRQWRVTDPDMEEVGMTLEHSALMIEGFERHGTFADAISWYKKQQEEAEYFKERGITPIANELDEYLGENMWLARFSEAQAIHKILLKQAEAGEITTYPGNYYDPRDQIQRKCHYISVKELRKFCHARHIFPEFLLPFEDEDQKTLAENKRLKSRIKELETELEKEQAYLDENNPLFIKEAAAVIIGYKHFWLHREKQSDSAKTRVRRWIRSKLKHYGLNNTALKRLEEVLNWESKEVN